MQDRSKSLHNFSLPCLKWGNQRVLRCVKVNADHHNHNRYFSNGFKSSFDTQKSQKSTPIQQNPVSPDLRFNGGAKRLKVSSLLVEDKAAAIDDSARPWNLRTRRAACKTPLRIEEKKNVDSPAKISEINSPSSLKKQGVEVVKFSFPLSKQEIEQDFMEMVKIRPPRRPKKRPRIVQKYLDSMFPGLWLTEVTADAYKVPQVPES